MTRVLKHMSESERFRHELEKLDRRIQKPGATPEQKQELFRQREQLFNGGREPSQSGTCA
jgi:hypothetical protein